MISGFPSTVVFGYLDCTMARFERIVILTGAGLSAESGLRADPESCCVR